MSSKFQTALLIGIAFVVVMLYMRRPEKQIPIVQDIEVTQPENRTIKVNSEGVVRVLPDTADIVILIETKNKELAVAKESNVTLTQKAMTLLAENGVPEDNVQVGFLRVKVYSTDVGIYGYVVSNPINITVHNLSNLESLLTALQKADEDIKISQVSLSISQINHYEEQALQIAIDSAQEKAKAITRKMGLQIGKAITIEQISPANSGDVPNSTFFSNIITANNLYDNYIYDDVLYVAFTEVAIKVQVTVTFELK